MKKRNLKSLDLNKKSISKLDHSGKIKGGSHFSCQGGYCLSNLCNTKLTCDTWVLCEPL